jgi:putative RecB family exonuclease
VLSGRCDRLDLLDQGLELIDYKSGKVIEALDAIEVNLQLGLYSLALAQQYGKSLVCLSLIYLRSGEKISFEVTPDHQQQVEAKIRELANLLLTEEQWHPKTGSHCQACTYARYCAAVQSEPEPLPDQLQPQRSLQLALQL